MPDQAMTDRIDKHRRYRINQKAKGRRLLRIWVPDTRTPEFQAEARRQALLLRGAPEEADALDFIDAAGDFSVE